MAVSRKGDTSQFEITAAIIIYCLCSAGMLLVNKLAVHHLPLPGLVTSCQFSACSAFVTGCNLGGCLKMDNFEWAKAKYFIIYVLAFTIGTFASIKVLSMANVETIIVFRSCTPLAVCILDYLYYNRAVPSLRSCFALLLITAGAIAYISTDRDFAVQGFRAYTWVMIWWAVLVFQLTYGKFLVSGLELASLWTPVLYTNTLSIVPALLCSLAAGELHPESLGHVQLTSASYIWLAVSCVFGIGISWSGFWCQSLVSATTYTVIGVMNKMLTVMVNVLIWDKHASPAGILALAVCLSGGTLYKQAPLRGAEVTTKESLGSSSSGDEESGSSDAESLVQCERSGSRVGSSADVFALSERSGSLRERSGSRRGLIAG